VAAKLHMAASMPPSTSLALPMGTGLHRLHLHDL
jgi:hypothetical protein